MYATCMQHAWNMHATSMDHAVLCMPKMQNDPRMDFKAFNKQDGIPYMQFYV